MPNTIIYNKHRKWKKRNNVLKKKSDNGPLSVVIYYHFTPR